MLIYRESTVQCIFLIIKPQTTLHHVMRCIVTCNVVRLCHFAGGFCGLVNTPIRMDFKLSNHEAYSNNAELGKCSFVNHELDVCKGLVEGPSPKHSKCSIDWSLPNNGLAGEVDHLHWKQ